LITLKPTIFVFNVSEENLSKDLALAKDFQPSVIICAKVEAELSELSEKDQRDYLAALGLTEPGLERLIRESYELLGLVTYFTAGEKETRAWTIKVGTKAPQAAGVIHTDFEKGFIKAEVINWEKLVKSGGWQPAREKGWVRLEGKEYVFQDGDTAIFKFNP
jgi:ribosome-binding ATPase YchF (GTP1/OBG family)